MDEPLLWFPFRDHDGKPWRGELSSFEISPDLRGPRGSRGYDGLTYCEDRRFIIDAASPRDVQDYVTLHELMHVSVIKEKFGREEENVISKMAPPLYKILRQFGLRWPERPPEAAALERRARRSTK